MDIINLLEHIKTGAFLEDGAFPFDVIVRDSVPADLPKTDIPSVSFSDINYDFGLSGQLRGIAEKYARILIINQSVNMVYLLPWIFSLHDDKQVTICNVAGISSYMSKAQPDLQDITLLLHSLPVKEAYDKKTLLTTLRAWGKKYIRLSFGETPHDIFPAHITEKGGVVDLSSQWFSGDEGTVLAPGGILVYTIHALQHLQDAGSAYDLFALADYDIQITDELKQSILKTEKLIVILDQKKRSLYEQTIKSKLRDAGLFDTEIRFIYPHTEKINTILPDYLWEQAGFDAQGLAEKLAST